MIKLVSFGYKNRQDRKALIELAPISTTDLRKVLDNPHNVEQLRPLDGRDFRVQAFVKQDSNFNDVFGRAMVTARHHKHGVLAFGCFGGRHRSVATVEIVAKALEKESIPVETLHLALD